MAAFRRRSHRSRLRSGSLRFALRAALAVAAGCPTAIPVAAQEPAPEPVFTRSDTLRGSNGPARAWWDVGFYDLEVRVDPETRSIEGSNAITFTVVADPPATRELQIDLQSPLRLDSVTLRGTRLSLRREGAAWFAALPTTPRVGDRHTVVAWYGGTPLEASNAPWDGGFVWARDGAGAPWIATANQGIGASVWWPTKDWQGEEPDSQSIAVTVPEPLVNVSNGRLRSVRRNPDGTTRYEWFVAAPINNYNVAVNAGSYAHWHEVYDGARGPLSLEFWPLAENLDAAFEQWSGETRTMLACFEEWFGPFPWYEDGFKLVETPYLGMEHQSAIAYGNGYVNGYRGTDLSGTGQGLAWDFILVHEAAHEWWGNHVTTADVADMWVHESFANYAENLYTECLTGSTAAGAEYVVGTRARIQNDRPIVGTYGVQHEGSGDMYYKGGNLLHTLRQWVDDDTRWKSILRGLQEALGGGVTTGAAVEDYIADRTGIDLDAFFDQYLRTTRVPVLEWRIRSAVLEYRWADVVDGFAMPVDVRLEGGYTLSLRPSREWTRVPVPAGVDSLAVDPDWYVSSRPLLPES
ncbi:MAG: M1 family metallopeptidase [Gemmatimonadetes bacterium]|nr:M1 family metallopeptidase [Gemmatimonadota bacterium]